MSRAAIREAMRHPDVLGAGAAKRRGLMPKDKIHTVMKEFKRGTLRSGGGGQKVTSRKQAIAIALSEARHHKTSPSQRIDISGRGRKK